MDYKTGNPALNANTFDQFKQTNGNPVVSGQTAATWATPTQESMTLDGTVGKSFLMLAILLAGSLWTWHIWFTTTDPAAVLPWTIGSSIAGFIVALVIIFNRTISPVLAPVYALLEGLCLGGLSAYFEAKFPGIVIQSVGLTMGTFAAMLIAYQTKLIRPSENFKLAVVSATGGIALLYLVDLVMIFGFHNQIPMIHSAGPWGIAFSIFVVIVAALNLVLDFDFIESGVQQRAPKYMEWYSAFGLIVTLVWLYLEILRLLSKARSRN